MLEIRTDNYAKYNHNHMTLFLPTYYRGCVMRAAIFWPNHHIRATLAGLDLERQQQAFPGPTTPGRRVPLKDAAWDAAHYPNVTDSLAAADDRVSVRKEPLEREGNVLQNIRLFIRTIQLYIPVLYKELWGQYSDLGQNISSLLGVPYKMPIMTSICNLVSPDIYINCVIFTSMEKIYMHVC